MSQLSAWFIKLGIYPELIEPGKPQQPVLDGHVCLLPSAGSPGNGVHERMHRTLKQEATIPPARSLKRQQQKFDAFREEFNQERPHEAIDMKRPAELYRPSDQRLPRKIETYDYPGHFLVRRVSRGGTIRVFHKQPFVSNVLQEDYVGLEEVDDGVYDLYFCFYQIGRYDLREKRIQDIVSKVPVRKRSVDLASRL